MHASGPARQILGISLSKPSFRIAPKGNANLHGPLAYDFAQIVWLPQLCALKAATYGRPHHGQRQDGQERDRVRLGAADRAGEAGPRSGRVDRAAGEKGLRQRLLPFGPSLGDST
jgi:hypothetical protein